MDEVAAEGEKVLKKQGKPEIRRSGCQGASEYAQQGNAQEHDGAQHRLPPEPVFHALRQQLGLLRNPLLVALIFRTLDALRVFDIFYVMVGGQGNMATMAVYNQQQLISFLDAGVGSSTSVIILIIIMLFVVLYTRFSRTSFE